MLGAVELVDSWEDESSTWGGYEKWDLRKKKSKKFWKIGLRGNGASLSKNYYEYFPSDFRCVDCTKSSKMH